MLKYCPSYYDLPLAGLNLYLWLMWVAGLWPAGVSSSQHSVATAVLEHDSSQTLKFVQNTVIVHFKRWPHDVVSYCKLWNMYLQVHKDLHLFRWQYVWTATMQSHIACSVFWVGQLSFNFIYEWIHNVILATGHGHKENLTAGKLSFKTFLVGKFSQKAL